MPSPSSRIQEALEKPGVGITVDDSGASECGSKISRNGADTILRNEANLKQAVGS